MKELSVLAKVYILSMIIVGLVFSLWQVGQLGEFLWEYLVLGILASIAQVLKIEGPTKQSSYNLSWLAYGFAYVMLGVPAAVFLILMAHAAEWIRYRYPWYIQLFNMASYMVALTVAGFLSQSLIPTDSPFTVASAMSALLVTITFTLLNHLMVGMVLKLARGESFKESGVFSYLTLIIDFTMFGVGVMSAYLWMVNPVTILFNIIPLYLFYNALKVPGLIRQVEQLEVNLEEVNLQASQMKADCLHG